ncbi:MAG: DmsC/YnfH family molybdoenzyme membrane anchor subunit [Pseudomonadota bacterium]
MHPALSVVFLTTLIGAGQGLFLVLFATELMHRSEDKYFYSIGAAIVLILCAAGLIASFFHLGRPERAWRAAAMWRTSWLSREVIALPAFMAAAFGYGAAHWFGSETTLLIGIIGATLSVVLFVCTGMIYAAIKVLREWAHPLTVINYLLLGCASGTTLSTFYAALAAPDLAGSYALAAFLLTLLAFVTRSAAMLRNAKLAPATTMQSAIGIKHPRIVQKTQGAMGGSFNTREFFHGKSACFIRNIRLTFLILAFIIPPALLLSESAAMFGLAFALQYLGLLAERWYFFADARHPQNLYYQTVS